MYGYIYKTTCLINNKIYIGQKTSSIFLGESYLGSGTLLKKAVEKYGKENFYVELISECDSAQELNETEVYWISKLNSTNKEIGYNIAVGGQGGSKPCSDETKKKHREAQTGRKMSEESCQKLSIAVSRRRYVYKDNIQLCIDKDELDYYIESGWVHGKLTTMSQEAKDKNRMSHLGLTHSDTTKQLLHDINVGKSLTEEHKKKISDSVKLQHKLAKENNSQYAMNGKKHTDEAKMRMSESAKKIDRSNRKYSTEGIHIINLDTGEQFNSIKEAQKIYHCNIYKYLSGLSKSAGGYKWKIIE